jgi:hypothetical protein
MLRSLVALLLLANLGFFAWSQGWLDNVAGVRATGDREPERLARQVHPELVRVVTPQVVAAAASAAESRLACLEAGPFDASGVVAAETALAATLPSGTWTRTVSERANTWIVYMGRYPNAEALKKKEQELSRIRVAFEEVTQPADLRPGLSLGRFTERSSADAALAQFTQRGINSAKVVELAQASTVYSLRVDRAEPELASKVAGLKLNALGRGFLPCHRPS